MLEKLKHWLQTYPGWEDRLQLDYAESVSGNAGLYPRGITEISCREDVQGNRKVRQSCTFTLKRAALPTEENARWLLAFQNWVADQDRLGLAPKFGDDPGSERIRAFEGRLEKHTQAGCALYAVQIYAEYTKIYRGE